MIFRSLFKKSSYPVFYFGILLFLVSCQSTPPKIDGISLRTTPAVVSVETLTKQFGLDPKHVGLIVWDPQSRKRLTGHNLGKQFIPASVSKVLVTVAALEILGPNYRFETRIRHTGNINRAGTLRGNLYLIGGGDPLLWARDLMKLALSLKRLRVKKIQGKFILDDSRYRKAEQIVPGKYNARIYNPSVSALASEFNRFFIHWRPGENKGRVHFTPDLIERSFRFAKDIDDFGYESSPTPHWLFPPVPNKAGRQKLPVKQSTLHTGLFFKGLCEMQGITLPAPQLGKRPRNAKTLVVHKSRPLHEITEAALEYSNNLVSELLILETAKKLTGETPTIESASKTIAAWFNHKLSLRQPIVFHDGAGLNSANRLSPKQVANVLHFADRRRYRGQRYLSFLPIGGWTGTLEKRLSEPESAFRVWAKTGTLDYATALAGYFYGRSNQKRIFAIFVTDFEKRNRWDKTQKEDRGDEDRAEAWIRRTRRFQDALLTQWIMKY